MENERTIRRLEEENAMLKEEVQILRDMILDMKFDDVKYLFTTCSKSELMDISHKGSFPFTLEFLQDAGIDIDYAMNYVDQKKDQLEKEARDKEKLSKYIDDELEYAESSLQLAFLAAQEAKLAFLEAVAAQKEYDEKYGEEDK